MPDPTTALQNVFSKNRTEELGYDVWKHFVIPPFYDRLDLSHARKPRIVIGGRGCGKTMLLRYFSHQSTFSPDRSPIPAEALSHVGLYWRVDTQFAKVMDGRNVPADTWISAFDHLLALVLGIQLLKSLESIARVRLISSEELAKLAFSHLLPYGLPGESNLTSLMASLKSALTTFEMWVANVRKVPEPIFLPGRHFLLTAIGEMKELLPSLSGTIFFVYLDEFENLLGYQQEIINTCLKHSESPLIFHMAMKRNGFSTTKTLGEESISNIADYRTHDLEQYLMEGDFHLFAAEVLLHNLATANLVDFPDLQTTIKDPSLIDRRRDDKYRSEVLSRVRTMLPGLSQQELAEGVFCDTALEAKLKKKIEQTLAQRKTGVSIERFWHPNLRQAMIILPALLSRPNLSPEQIATELECLSLGKDNRFTGKTNWIHNNFIGSLLWLYESQPRACPFYAGFDTFCVLARGNMRHFLELCHKSLNQAGPKIQGESWIVSPTAQANAARQASADFLGEIRSFGRLGNKLHTFVLRLGSLFALAQSRTTQSEPELCHFAVTRGNALDDEDTKFIREAVKWSVLFEEESTKVKDKYQPADFDYILNPIYSPYFHISYRKRRRLEITSDELHTLISGSYESVKEMLRSYSKRWEVNLPEANQLLFSHLLESGQ